MKALSMNYKEVLYSINISITFEIYSFCKKFSVEIYEQQIFLGTKRFKISCLKLHKLFLTKFRKISQNSLKIIIVD